MNGGKTRIGIVAPSSRLEHPMAERVTALAAQHHPTVELVFHPQCFLSSGHFAGSDAERAAAFIEIANDPSFDALWFGRGGYGSCRMAGDALAKVNDTARNKTYLGYSDAGVLLAGLYANGFRSIVHGPMPADIVRAGGEAAVMRSLAFLATQSPEALESSVAASGKVAAFNLMTFSQLLGTPLQPDLTDHVLMLEEVSEYMYRIDRSLFHVTSNPAVRRVAGIRLGRCSAIPDNDPPFGQTEVEIVQHWCKRSGIPYLGRADIGHDADNKIVPFGGAGSA
ncbi:MAG TPA: LD-carboxypeptidase [Dongiaceae bacterium]|nr:LD-carboxypeptidase [Dongiaceae bacterium]